MIRFKTGLRSLCIDFVINDTGLGVRRILVNGWDAVQSQEQKLALPKAVNER